MGKYQQKNVWLFVYSVRMAASPIQTLLLVQSYFPVLYLMKTKGSFREIAFVSSMLRLA